MKICLLKAPASQRDFLGRKTMILKDYFPLFRRLSQQIPGVSVFLPFRRPFWLRRAVLEDGSLAGLGRWCI